MSSGGPWIAALFGLTGVALGATLSHFYSTEREEQNAMLELRSQAYFQFLEGQANLQEGRQLMEQPEDLPPQILRYREAVKNARLKIGVLGSADLINALTDYFLLNPPGRICAPDWSADVRIYQTMRGELLPAEEASTVDDARLHFLLWNCLPPPLAEEAR